MAEFWMSLGVLPAAMLGHSLGEYAAACIAGVMSLDNALEIIAYRAMLMQNTEEGKMAAIFLPEEELSSLIPTSCSLASSNGKGNCTVSGPKRALDEFLEYLAKRGVATKTLAVTRAFHSSCMEPILDEFEKKLSSFPLQAPRIPFISCLTGNWITDSQAKSPAYWAAQLRQSVRFDKGVTKVLESCDLFLETGPGTALSSLIVRSAGKQVSCEYSCRAPENPGDQYREFLASLGRLFLLVPKINWNVLYSNGERRKLRLPTYPFEGKKHWIEGAAPAQNDPKKTYSDHRGEAADEIYPSKEAVSSGPELNSDRSQQKTEFEERLIYLCEELFGIKEISLEGNFYEMGGDSLLATQLASRIRLEFDVDFRLKDILTSITLSQLAKRIRDLKGAQAGEIGEPLATPNVEEGLI